MTNSAGATDAAYSKISKTFSDTALIFKSQLQAVFIEAGVINISSPRNAQANQPEDNSLETVRDILFGAQARDIDKRTAHLEKLIKTSVDKLERDFDRKLNSLDKSIEKLKDQLKREKETTAQRVNSQFKDVDEQLGALAARSQAELNDAQDVAGAELQDLEKRALSWNEDLAKQLEIVHMELKNTKTDRSTLSELLASMAVAIADNDQK